MHPRQQPYNPLTCTHYQLDNLNHVLARDIFLDMEHWNGGWVEVKVQSLLCKCQNKESLHENWLKIMAFYSFQRNSRHTYTIVAISELLSWNEWCWYSTQLSKMMETIQLKSGMVKCTSPTVGQEQQDGKLSTTSRCWPWNTWNTSIITLLDHVRYNT